MKTFVLWVSLFGGFVQGRSDGRHHPPPPRRVDGEVAAAGVEEGRRPLAVERDEQAEPALRGADEARGGDALADHREHIGVEAELAARPKTGWQVRKCVRHGGKEAQIAAGLDDGGLARERGG